jgi:hypothetical protein
MKKILVLALGDMDVVMFNRYAPDGMHDAGIEWRKRLEERGVILEQAKDQDLDGVVGLYCHDGLVARTEYGLDWLAKAAGAGIRTVLTLWEAPGRWPENYDPALLDMFDVVLTWNDDIVNGKHIRKMCWPQPGGTTARFGTPFADRRLLCAISGNKSCDHPDELYTRRIKDYLYFAETGDFDLFGTGFDGFPAYKGPVASKSDVFENYRFALVYENLRSPRGYVTEKPFDCLRGGCVPVYLGCENYMDYIDRGCMVHRKDFVSLDSLYRFLRTMSPKEWESMRECGRDYLASEGYRPFQQDLFDDIDTYLGV